MTTLSLAVLMLPGAKIAEENPLPVFRDPPQNRDFK
jgi:hypothetical protein